MVLLLVGRTRASGRRLLDEPRTLHDVAAASNGSVDVVRSRVVFFEGLPLREQMELTLGAGVMLGIDGTGLMVNAFWMTRGSLVLHVMPYGNHLARLSKGTNFHRLWEPAGLRVRRVFVRDLESSVGLQPLCVECVRWLARPRELNEGSVAGTLPRARARTVVLVPGRARHAYLASALRRSGAHSNPPHARGAEHGGSHAHAEFKFQPQ